MTSEAEEVPDIDCGRCGKPFPSVGWGMCSACRSRMPVCTGVAERVEVAFNENGSYAASFEDAHHVNDWALSWCPSALSAARFSGAQVRVLP